MPPITRLNDLKPARDSFPRINCWQLGKSSVLFATCDMELKNEGLISIENSSFLSHTCT